MGFGPSNDDPIGSPFDNMSEEVGICLLARGERPVSLRIGHAADHHDIAILDIDQIFLEPFEVVCLIFLIHVISGHVSGIQGIESHASLKARACLMSDETEHLDFFNQIIHTLMDVGESVDLPAGEMGGGRHQVLIFGTKGELIGEGGRVDVGTNSRMLGNILHALPVIIDGVMKIFQTLDVIGFGYDSFHFVLLRVKSKNPWIKAKATTSVPSKG
jgi:hypothetical protein